MQEFTTSGPTLLAFAANPHVQAFPEGTPT